LFEAEEPKEEHPPLLLWIQGGPGSSSGVGLFYEVSCFERGANGQFGPYTLTEDLILKKNPFSWTKHFDVLFVDNPVGTGYSYVDPPAQVPSIYLQYSSFHLIEDLIISSRQTLHRATWRPRRTVQ
jgi:carboxypeptidase C (cathepsin A)